jgi:hypothetical protein
MDDKTILDKLIAAKPLADLIIDHNYLPSGNYNVVVSLSEIYTYLYKGNVQLHCPSCVREMFIRLYHYYYVDAIKELKPKENGTRQTKSNRKS